MFEHPARPSETAPTTVTPEPFTRLATVQKHVASPFPEAQLCLPPNPETQDAKRSSMGKTLED